MGVRTLQYVPTLSADTERGPSPQVWAWLDGGNAGPEDFLQDPRLGMYVWDDFNPAGNLPSSAAAAVLGALDNWSVYLGKTAVISDAGIVGGALSLTPGTSASNEPINFASTAGAFQITTASTSGLQGRLAFEARVMLQSVTASKRDAFVGLMDGGASQAINVPIVAGTTTNNMNSSQNFLGFYNPYSGSAQDWCFVYGLANTATVFPTNLQSLISTITGSAIVAGTYYKLGFVFDPFAYTTLITSASTGQTVGTYARQMLTVYVNGQKAAAYLSQAGNVLTASFPTGIMGPTFGICNEVSSVGASTNAGAMSVDWVRVAQNAIT
jgi:hypothetical protein